MSRPKHANFAFCILHEFSIAVKEEDGVLHLQNERFLSSLFQPCSTTSPIHY